MSGKASLRIVELLERARIEGDWTHVSQVRQTKHMTEIPHMAELVPI